MLHGLVELWPSYLAYAVTFLFIGQVWANHHINAVWQHACRHRLLSEALAPAGATAIGRRFQLAVAWLLAGALLGAALPVLGVVAIAAFNAFYWLPIRGETPRPPL